MKLANRQKPDSEKPDSQKATANHAVALTFAEKIQLCKFRPCQIVSRHGATNNVTIIGSDGAATGAGPRAERDLIHVAMNDETRRAVVFFTQNLHNFHKKHRSDNLRTTLRKCRAARW